MGGDFWMIGLHWLFVVCALIISWSRSRNYLHPHFIFTAMLCVFLSDFLIRGYEDPNLEYISRTDIYSYQIDILFIFAIAVIATAFVRVREVEVLARQAAQAAHFGIRTQRLIFFLALGILALDLLKRLSAVHWSVDEVVMQSLHPRGQRDWDQAAFSGNFFFAITTIILPLSSFSFAYLSLSAKGLLRIGSMVRLAAILALLITNGSRTPVAMTFAALSLLIVLRQKRLFSRLVMLGLVGVCAVGALSLMYNYRSVGYLEEASGQEVTYKATYHQDDSYYRSIYSYNYADYSGKRWDAAEFFGIVAMNPIPRMFWPNKPVLDVDFYDGYKLDYVTTLFLGEIVAMTGVTLSMVFAPIFAFCIYLLLYNSVRVMAFPLGLGVYLILALYVYMCMRSMANMTMFVYLPVAALAAATLLRSQVSARRRLGANYRR